MFNFTKYLRSGLVLSAVTAISLGLSAGSVNAQEEDDEKEKEASSREVLVECDKGQSVTQILRQFANDTKLLEIIVKGTCDNEPEGEVQIERNKVDLIGDEETGGSIPFLLVDGGRQIGIGDNLTLAGGLAIGAGQVEIETETYLIIENGIFLSSQSKLGITTEETEDEEESTAGQVIVNGQIWVTNHSLLEVQREVSDGIVMLNGTEDPSQDHVIVSLQSSVDIKKASVGNIYLERDSHASFNGDVTPKDGFNTISCDSESRVWGATPGFDAGLCPGF